jgi:preprotein translocase subunit SecD
MTVTDDRAVDELIDANPHPRGGIADPSEDPRAQAMFAAIMARPAADRPPRHLERDRTHAGVRVLAPVLSLVVVVAVTAVLLHVGSGRHSTAGGGTAGEVVLSLHPTPAVPRATAAAVGEEIQILRARMRSLGTGPGVRFTRAGDEIVVRSRAIAASPLARTLLTKDPQVTFTDWEQNVIAPDGRTAASLLLGGNRQAEILSQGHAGDVGTSNSGARTLYAAVRLASLQPTRADAVTLTRRGPQSFAFAPAGSGRCRTSNAPCWAAGPSMTPATAASAARRAGVAKPIVLTVPQGTTIVRASDPAAAPRPDYPDAGARYYVMRDDAALTGLELRRMSASTDAAGQPDVAGRLTAAGVRAFRRLTAEVAHRGQNLRLGADSFFQHVAIVIDGVLASVPQIDYEQYPDGVIVSSGIQIDGLSRARATQLADLLRLRTLPLQTTITRG